MSHESIHKFAHITDCHLGAWRISKLRDLNLKAFEQAIARCIQEKVDFILITGDFFDVNVPDLAPVKRAVEILRGARENGIEVYLIYGSHDFSPNSVSMIDILHSAGLFTKPTEYDMVGDKIRLKFFQDKRTGVKITGISGRTKGLEAKYYELLDLDYLESEPGFKIFLFHAPITEITPADQSFGEGIPFSLFPKTFKYYGSGHVHKRVEDVLYGGNLVVYPGPLFGATFTDLENTASGEKRGFYIVEFNDEKIFKSRFIEVNVADIVYEVVDADKKTAKQTESKLYSLIEKADVKDKIVLFKVKGLLSSGKRSDINFSGIEEQSMKKGSYLTYINKWALVSEEISKMQRVLGESKEVIEDRIFKERIQSFEMDKTITDPKVKSVVKTKFVSDNGVKTGKELLRRLKIEKIENETKQDFADRVLSETTTVLDFAKTGEDDLT